MKSVGPKDVGEFARGIVSEAGRAAGRVRGRVSEGFCGGVCCLWCVCFLVWVVSAAGGKDDASCFSEVVG